MKAYRCMSCGQGMVQRAARPGRVARYLAVKNLPIPARLALPECGNCGEMFLDARDEAALTRALAASFKKHALAKAQKALSDLKRRGVRERRVEALLGLSPNYLSRIRAGKETSVTLATALLLLADDPLLIEDAEKLWQTEAAPERFIGGVTFLMQARPVAEFQHQHFNGVQAVA